MAESQTMNKGTSQIDSYSKGVSGGVADRHTDRPASKTIVQSMKSPMEIGRPGTTLIEEREVKQKYVMREHRTTRESEEKQTMEWGRWLKCSNTRSWNDVNWIGQTRDKWYGNCDIQISEISPYLSHFERLCYIISYDHDDKIKCAAIFYWRRVVTVKEINSIKDAEILRQWTSIIYGDMTGDWDGW